MDRKEIIVDITDSIRILNYDKHDTKMIIEEFLRRVKAAVTAGDEVCLHEFGTFKNVLKNEKKLTTVVRSDRQKNKVPEEIVLPKRYVIEFLPSPWFEAKKLKTLSNSPT